VSHETIYGSLFVQSKAALRPELTSHVPNQTRPAPSAATSPATVEIEADP
jgi:hypothetical protein